MTNTTSSTGGRIIKTSGGLIHYGNTERYSTDELVVRSAGRPTKISIEEGLKFDFSAFMSPVKMTSPRGRIVSFK